MRACFAFRMILLVLLAGVGGLFTGCAGPESFSSPMQATNSLVMALRNNDQPTLHKILGPDAEEILTSGDPVADKNKIDTFLASYDEKHQMLLSDDGQITITVGDDDWPMPIPIVKDKMGSSWHFDVAAGKDEMLNRRIGRNELDAIQTCLAIADAQNDYTKLDPEHLANGKTIYAQKFLSDAGKKNGLYWETKENETDSPLGPQVVAATAEGYSLVADHPTPYHGYYYRMLKSAGPHASGGAKDYIVDGKMTGGFALVAYPADFGNSGISTFIVSDHGIVYAADLGEDTAKIASQMSSFDPDEKWVPIETRDE